MGDDVNDIQRSFVLSEDKKRYKIEAYFVKKWNVIFESVQFNMQWQEGGEAGCFHNEPVQCR